ncbi:MAG: FtsK/SpoIIIE domain-containing protein [Actinomycetota bacterium]|nr:FtsK/SpoIIIE domain-containing protein [Actinomycetota bacterium]
MIRTAFRSAFVLAIVAGIGAVTHAAWLFPTTALLAVLVLGKLAVDRWFAVRAERDTERDGALSVGTVDVAVYATAALASLVAFAAPTVAGNPLAALALGPGALLYGAWYAHRFWAGAGVPTRPELAWSWALDNHRVPVLVALALSGLLAALGALVGLPLTILPVAAVAVLLRLGWPHSTARLAAVEHLRAIAANAVGERNTGIVGVGGVDWLAGSDDTISSAVVMPPQTWVPPRSTAEQALHDTFQQHGYVAEVQHANRAICVAHAPAVEPVPERADWDGGVSENPMSIRLGVSTDAQEVSWDLSAAPHALFTGATGSGKTSTILCSIAQAHAHGFDVWALDPKQSEFGFLSGRVERVARGLDECWQALIDAEAQMRERQALMDEHGVRHWRDVPDMRPMLIVVDEAFDLLAAGLRDKARKAQQDAAADALQSIAGLGRAPGVHLIVAAQRPDAKVLAGAMRNNLRCRLLLGRPLQAEALMVLDGISDVPDVAPGAAEPPKGRGLAQTASPSAPVVLQAWYASDEAVMAALPEAREEGDEAAPDELPEPWPEREGEPEPAAGPGTPAGTITLHLDDDTKEER